MSQDIISEFYDYNIMFTNQITQKVKKWNDGRLKYFAFNKKAQIFNSDGILISSAFLKNNHQLAEPTWGEEVKIGGVLITIDSLMSSNTRDISNIFQKSKSINERTPGPLRTKTIRVSNVHTPNTPNTPITPSNVLRRRVGLSKSTTPSQLKIKQHSLTPSSIHKPFAARIETPTMKTMTSSPPLEKTDEISTKTAVYKPILSQSIVHDLNTPNKSIGTTSRPNITNKTDASTITIHSSRHTAKPVKLKSDTSNLRSIDSPVSCTSPSKPDVMAGRSVSPKIIVQDKSNKQPQALSNGVRPMLNLNPISTRASRSLLVTRNRLAANPNPNKVSTRLSSTKNLVVQQASKDGTITDKRTGYDDNGKAASIRESSEEKKVEDSGKVKAATDTDVDGTKDASISLLDQIDEELKDDSFDYDLIYIKKERLEQKSLEEQLAREDHIGWDFGNNDDDLMNMIKKSIEQTDTTPSKTKRKVTNIVQSSRYPLSEVNTNKRKRNRRKVVDDGSSDVESIEESPLDDQPLKTKINDIEKLTQTETYNYGRKPGGYKVSELTGRR